MVRKSLSEPFVEALVKPALVLHSATTTHISHSPLLGSQRSSVPACLSCLVLWVVSVYLISSPSAKERLYKLVCRDTSPQLSGLNMLSSWGKETCFSSGLSRVCCHARHLSWSTCSSAGRGLDGPGPRSCLCFAPQTFTVSFAGVRLEAQALGHSITLLSYCVTSGRSLSVKSKSYWCFPWAISDCKCVAKFGKPPKVKLEWANRSGTRGFLLVMITLWSDWRIFLKKLPRNIYFSFALRAARQLLSPAAKVTFSPKKIGL